MKPECINLRKARNWIDFTDRQFSDLAKALEKACANQEIMAAIEHDADCMNQNNLSKRMTDDELIRLYGEEMYLMHPVLFMLSCLDSLIEKYRAHHISDQVLRDTLSDLRIWMDVCEKQTGKTGLLEVSWLANTFTFSLFRLGRLQFMYGSSSVQAVVYRHRETRIAMALCPNGTKYHEDGQGGGVNGRSLEDAWTAQLTETEEEVKGFPIHPCGYAAHHPVTLNKQEWELMLKPDDPVLDIHIAEGCPLSPEAISESLRMAPAFFKEHLGISDARAFTCGSWLLDDNIALIQPEGNIAHFQRRFHRTPQPGESDWQTRQRAFGDEHIDVLSAACSTSLQKAIKAWYKAGNKCCHCEGFILM